MSEYLIQDTSLIRLANAVRTVTNTTKSYTIEEMITALNNLEINDWYSFYRVQTGAYSVVSNAEAMYNTIKNLGYDPVIVKDNYWRINIGPFSTLEQAQACGNSLADKSIAYIILNPS